MSTQPNVHQLYRRLETVGKGAYGSVHKGLEIATGNVVALKIINLDADFEDVADIQREVALLTQLREAINITKYYGCYLDGPRVWIVMEFASGGSVRTLMKACKDNIVEEKYVVIIVRESLIALAYLHKMGVIHRDIKAANVLVTATGKVMLCDFGVSAQLLTSRSKRNTLVGTPYWMAPEVAQAVPAYDTKADIWSLGITIYEFVTGSPPHANLDGQRVIHLIPRTQPPRLPETTGSKDMRDFVATCLRELPHERPPAEELAKSKWIKSISRTPVSVLKELVVQYENWQAAGGTRASIATPLAWEEEEAEELQNMNQEDENPWEFDTMRSRTSFMDFSDTSSAPASGSSDQESSDIDRTARRPGNVRFPNSLRSIFESDSSSSSSPAFEPFVPPPMIDLSRSTSASPAQSRSRTPSRPFEGEEPSGLAPSPSPFRFPPAQPPETPSAPKTPDSYTVELEVPDSRHTSNESLLSAEAESSNRSPNTIKPNTSLSSMAFAGKHEDGDLDEGPTISMSTSPLPRDFLQAAPSPSMARSEKVQNRKRSPSNAIGAGGTRLGEFHFPPLPSPSPAAPAQAVQLASRPPSLLHDNAAGRRGVVAPFPTSHASASENRPEAPHHQTAHSFDSLNFPASGRSILDKPDDMSNLRTGERGLGLPPSLSRTQSANPLAPSSAFENVSPVRKQSESSTESRGPSRRPSLNRQASVAVMESVPARPLASDLRSLPPLKDILKPPVFSSEILQMNNPDLLPPSPSIVTTFNRFPPLPPSSKPDIPEPEPTVASVSNVNAVQEPGESPTLSDSKLTVDSTSASSASNVDTFQMYPGSSQGSLTSISTTASTRTLFGPVLRPLDLSALMTSHDATHAELAHTVEDLTQWLKIVEVGLSTMLEQTASPGHTADSSFHPRMNGGSLSNGHHVDDVTYDEDLPSAHDFSIDPLRPDSVFDEFKDFEFGRSGSITPYNASVESFDYFPNNFDRGTTLVQEHEQYPQ